MSGTTPVFKEAKILEFQSHIYNNKPDVVIINESWLNNHVNNNEIISDDIYNFFRFDRTTEDMNFYKKVRWGGIFILIRRELEVETSVVKAHCKAPILSIAITFKDGSKICLCTCYRYGYSGDEMHLEIDTYLKELSKKFNKIVLVGDFNLKTISDWDHHITACTSEYKYLETFEDVGLTQLINQPAYWAGNILDLLLTNNPGLLKNIRVVPNGICVSDHFSIYFTLNTHVPRKRFPKRRMYNFKKADWVGLNSELRSTNWLRCIHNNVIHSTWNVFKSKLDQSLSKYIPTINVKSKFQPPWFDSEVYHICIEKERLRSRAKKSGSIEDRNKYNLHRKAFKKKAKEKMCIFIADDPCDNNTAVKKKF